jgi:hypothetical protein
MTRPTKYEKLLYCSICGKHVGSRMLCTMELEPGADAEFIATCGDCMFVPDSSQPENTMDVPDFLMGILNGKRK